MNPKSTKVKPDLASSLVDTPHFIVLGSYGLFVAILIKKTSKIVYESKETIGSKLISLAPLAWWLEMGQDLQNKSVRRQVHSAIIEAAMLISGNMPVWGRGGAAMKNAGYIYNLGDRLITEGKSGDLEVEMPLDMDEAKGIPGRPLRLRDNENASQYGKDLVQAVMACRWASNNDGKAFLGWLVASLIGGVLRRRPIVWIHAPTSSGKPWLSEHVISKFMGDCLHKLTDVTEADLICQVGYDALPVYIPGFQPTEGTESDAVLRLLRSACDGRLLHLEEEENVSYPPRFSTLLTSINRPNLSDFDAKRSYILGLGRTEVDDWERVKNEIVDATTEEKMLAVRSYVIKNTPKIAEMAKRMEREIEVVTQVQIEKTRITAALSAGYSFLSGEHMILEVQLPEDQHDE